MTVHEPTTMAALATAIESDLDALLVAGGTQVMRSPARQLGGRAIISLRGVEPLGRISRSQRFLDLGATVPLSRILSIGPRVVPAALFEALKATASPTVRVLATLGGNICARGVEHTSLTALAVLDATLEFRLGAAARSVPAAQFWRGGNNLAIRAGELLCRVRVPLDEFGLEEFVEDEVGWPGGTLRVTSSAVAAVHKDVVEELRFCFASVWSGTLRVADFESACSGLHLPLRDRTAEDLLSVLKRSVLERLQAAPQDVAPILGSVVGQGRRLLRLLGGGEAPLPRRRVRERRPWGAARFTSGVGRGYTD